MPDLKPMDAVAALYSREHPEVSEAIIASLSDAIFGGAAIRPAGPIQRLFARVSYTALRLTTASSRQPTPDGNHATSYTNPILERSKHPYAASLLTSSRIETESLVEGGDPMNGNYMLLDPAIRARCELWDRLLLDSVQGKDVRLRLALETRATYEAAKHWLDRGESVRIKGLAAGTGLSLILAYDRLVRDGIDPSRITAVVTDREPANIEKTLRLIDKLPTTRERRIAPGASGGICAQAEDIFAWNPDDDDHVPCQVLTAIGILEYFQGFSFDTTEQRLKLPPPAESDSARHLVNILSEMTADQARLIVNTYRADPSTRILELFGRRFVYRSRENLSALMASGGFRPVGLVGSGHVYDVEVYEKDLRDSA